MTTADEKAPAPAGVPMPEAGQSADEARVAWRNKLKAHHTHDFGRGAELHPDVIADAMRVGEAAGYARGLAEAGRDAERYRWLRDKRRTGELDTHGIYIGVDSPRFVGKWALSGEEADSEIDAALRGGG